MRIDFIEADVFDVGSGVSIRIQDLLGTDVSQQWDPGVCSRSINGAIFKCYAAVGGGPGTAYKAILRQTGTPTAWHAIMKLRQLEQTTSPPAGGFLPPFRGPLTLTLTYKPLNGTGPVSHPGVIRDCKVLNRGLRCKEP
jgi:hypothetical protein